MKDQLEKRKEELRKEFDQTIAARKKAESQVLSCNARLTQLQGAFAEIEKLLESAKPESVKANGKAEARV